ncbi:hypothetical protein [Flavobacterium sp. JP2137]|uniref:hypothetical protein n=1 Tax=Flavobacterium sp. JP2137 TaxID=3414510 RepID=UPI003D2FDF57
MEVEKINELIIKDIRKKTDVLKTKILVDTDSFRLETRFIKSNPREIFTLGYMIDERFTFYGFKIYVCYLELESIVASILINNSLVGDSYNYLDKASHKLNELNFYPQNGFIIENKESIDLISKQLVLLYEREFLSYSAHWHSLTVLYDFIKDKEDREELHPILGMFWQFKKATILRLCNDKNYQNYMDTFVESRQVILNKVPESIDVQRYYNAAKELKEILDKTEPVYNI